MAEVYREYTVTELSKRFDVSRATIHNWLDAGRFPNYRKSGVGYLVPQVDVDTLVKEMAQEHIDALRTLGFRGELIPA